ncbi:MAG TPA: helix-turn-helix transcriptional regulator [Vicinamibacterales bacterium]|nr:helix-turn-helix transcriptional regulator [Vicinamibacterales bacterium]
MRRRHALTEFELLILLAILRLGEEAYGVTVAREIEQRAGRTVLLGPLYTALTRLEQNGLVSSTQGDPTPERGGRSKRYFAVTRAGVRAARDARAALTSMWTGVPQLKGATG